MNIKIYFYAYILKNIGLGVQLVIFVLGLQTKHITSYYTE